MKKETNALRLDSINWYMSHVDQDVKEWVMGNLDNIKLLGDIYNLPKNFSPDILRQALKTRLADKVGL